MQLDDLPSSEDLSYQIEDDVVQIAGIHNGDEAEQWLKKYGNAHNTVWRVLRTFPQSSEAFGKLFVYKKQFRCQHNTKKKPVSGTGENTRDHDQIIKRHKSKNTNCPARVLITISRKLESEFRCSVTFTHVHNHPTSSHEALHYQPVQESSRLQMEQLFRRGHSPATAYVAFCQRRRNQLGAEGFAAAIADRRQVPTRGDFYTEWKRLRAVNASTPLDKTDKHAVDSDMVTPEVATRVPVGDKDDVSNGYRHDSTDAIENFRANGDDVTIMATIDVRTSDDDAAPNTRKRKLSSTTCPIESTGVSAAAFAIRSKDPEPPLPATTHRKYHVDHRETTLRQLRAWCAEYVSQGRLCQLAESDAHLAVAVCTPSMLRAHQLLQSHNIVYLDAPSHCDALRHRIYFFLAPSAVGGVPLGCIITDRGKARSFQAGLAALNSLLPRCAFGGAGANVGPRTIVIGSCGGGGDLAPAELKALHTIWPKCRVSLDALESCWRWLRYRRLEPDQRQHHYAVFRDTVYAIGNGHFDIHERLHAESLHPAFIAFAGRLSAMNCPIGCDPDHARQLFRLRADGALQSTRAFRLSQLADYVGREFDDHYRQSVLDALRGVPLLEHPPTDNDGARNGGDTVDPTGILPLTQCSYLVPSATKADVFYIVDMNIGVCSCAAGAGTATNTEHICHHQMALLGHRLAEAVAVIPAADRAELYRVVTGRGVFVDSGTKSSTPAVSPLVAAHSTYEPDLFSCDERDDSDPWLAPRNVDPADSQNLCLLDPNPVDVDRVPLLDSAKTIQCLDDTLGDQSNAATAVSPATTVDPSGVVPIVANIDPFSDPAEPNPSPVSRVEIPTSSECRELLVETLSSVFDSIVERVRRDPDPAVDAAVRRFRDNFEAYASTSTAAALLARLETAFIPISHNEDKP